MGNLWTGVSVESYSGLDPTEDTESHQPIPMNSRSKSVTVGSIRQRILKGRSGVRIIVRLLCYSGLDPTEDTERPVVQPPAELLQPGYSGLDPTEDTESH